MSFLKFWEELEAMKPLDLSGLRTDFDEEEYNEYLDKLEEQSVEQELPEDYQF